MTCGTFEKLLAQLHTESASEFEVWAARRHRRQCRSCRMLYEISAGERTVPSKGQATLTNSILRQTSGFTCHTVRRRLSAWLTESVKPDDPVLAHLENCRVCRESARELLRPTLPAAGTALAAVGGWCRRHSVRLSQQMQRVLRRPRFSLEATLAGTLVVVTLLGGPSGVAASVRTAATQTSGHSWPAPVTTPRQQTDEQVGRLHRLFDRFRNIDEPTRTLQQQLLQAARRLAHRDHPDGNPESTEPAG